MPRRIFVGTAGWSIPRASAPRFEGEGSHLERYARVFSCAEINSSFHRPHSPGTYGRWAASTPGGFRFPVKLPRTITHDWKLRRSRLPLERFLEQSSALGTKRGPLLVQLPPSLAFDARVARRFLDVLRSGYGGQVVCEPRHPTWFSAAADALLIRYEVARAAADPAPVDAGERPGGWAGLAYFRMHGAPRKYWSRYEATFITALAESVRRLPDTDVWCVFDNTASGAAVENAWELQRLLAGG